MMPFMLMALFVIARGALVFEFTKQNHLLMTIGWPLFIVISIDRVLASLTITIIIKEN